MGPINALINAQFIAGSSRRLAARFMTYEQPMSPDTVLERYQQKNTHVLG